MYANHDTTTFELGEAKLGLRPNLRFSVQRGRHGNSYLIEDLATGDFYRIGEGEYTFLSLLDGKTTIATALATTCSLVGASAFNEQDAASLCKWLVDSGLAATKASAAADRISKRREEVEKAQFMQILNPISIRIPLFNPDRLVASTQKYFGWIFSIPMAVAWIIVGLFALLSLLANVNAADQPSIEIFHRDNVFWLSMTWLLLKLVHEYSHAFACRQFGGRVSKCGILFLLLIPLPFVDVTSAWRFGNKYHRILVSAAGMLSEIFIAAIATLVWLSVDPGLTSQIAANIMFAASINTLIFNANPLMKFDGYHMLADWMEMPNLAKYGNQHVMGVCRKNLLGLTQSPLPWAGKRALFVKCYGWGALIWKILICVSLVLGAANLLPGIGFLVALLAAVLWLALPAAKFIRFLIHGNEFEQPDRIHFGKVIGFAAVGLLAVGMVAPSPSVITAPIVVQYASRSVIRSESQGFVETVHVHPDQPVKAGELLITLRNRELDARLVETTNRVKEAKLAASAHQQQRNIGAWQIEQQNIAALEKQLAETQNDVAQLSIKAPIAGKVIIGIEESLLGTYVLPGQELLTVADTSTAEAIALVSQSDAQHLADATGSSVQLRIWGSGQSPTGTIKEVTPRVQTQLPHFAFAGSYGGPLSVVNRSGYQASDDTIASNEEAADLVLLEPRITMRIEIDKNGSETFFDGQTGLAHLRLRTGALGPYLVHRTGSWIKDRIYTTHGL